MKSEGNMKNKDFVDGVNIISKYLKPESFSIVAEHDQVWFGQADLVTSAEDRHHLEWMGWFISEESYSCFV